MVSMLLVWMYPLLDTFIACVISKYPLLMCRMRGNGMAYFVQTIQFEFSQILVKPGCMCVVPVNPVGKYT